MKKQPVEMSTKRKQKNLFALEKSGGGKEK